MKLTILYLEVNYLNNVLKEKKDFINSLTNLLVLVLFVLYTTVECFMIAQTNVIASSFYEGQERQNNTEHVFPVQL